MSGHYLAEILDRLLQMRSSPGTSGFRELGHNEDLCPLVEDRARHVTERYNFQSNVIYDVQGPQDEGADVIIRLGGTEGPEFICFQIKSDREMTGDKLDTLLRSQYVQANDAYRPMIRYYILPFADVDVGLDRPQNWKKRREIVTRINGVFKGFTKVLVVQPEMLKTFIELTDTRIDAFVKAVLGHDDFVLNQCRQELGELPDGYALPVALLCAHFVTDPSGTTPWTELISEAVELPGNGLLSGTGDLGDSSEDLAVFLEHLEDQVVRETGMKVRISPDGFSATVALMHDARVRFGYTGTNVVDYLGFLT